MTLPPLPRLMVAPNGARRSKADHPALPVTIPETVATARACHVAGADGLHLHIRDEAGGHSLDPGLYREALADLRQAVPGMALQITTEAVGIYDVAAQLAALFGSGASLASVAVREIRAELSATKARKVYADCAEAGISVQHILYDLADIALLAETLGQIGRSVQVLYVLGRYTTGQVSSPADLDPFLAEAARLGLSPEWGVCAFGAHETACLMHAHAHGGKMRVGFENNMLMADGTVAADNAARVAEVSRMVAGG